MIDVKKIPQFELDILSKPLIPKITEFYNNPENQKEYEEWHFKKYGHYPTNASYMK